ncbi:MAG TPA: hypothetical protein VJH37_01985 [Candidatus Nanoarchaeia archaeon]|nr:hypothetical protein [Candidatus Nanoarchaeia archaeon]
MTHQKFELPRLPSLSELEARAEAELGEEPEIIERVKELPLSELLDQLSKHFPKEKVERLKKKYLTLQIQERTCPLYKGTVEIYEEDGKRKVRCPHSNSGRCIINQPKLSLQEVFFANHPYCMFVTRGDD